MIMQTECDTAQRRSYTCWYGHRRECQNSIPSIINPGKSVINDSYGWFWWWKVACKGPSSKGEKKPSCVWQDDINLHCLERSPAARRCSASPGTSPAWGCIRPAVAPAAARWRSCRHRNGTTIWKKEGIKISYSESGLWYLIASLSKNWFLSLIVSFLAPYCWTRKN